MEAMETAVATLSGAVLINLATRPWGGGTWWGYQALWGDISKRARVALINVAFHNRSKHPARPWWLGQ